MDPRNHPNWDALHKQASAALRLTESPSFKRAQEAAAGAASFGRFDDVAATAAEAALWSGSQPHLHRGLFDSLLPEFNEASRVLQEAMSASRAWDTFRAAIEPPLPLLDPYFESALPASLNAQLQDIAFGATRIDIAHDEVLSNSDIKNQLDDLIADVWQRDDFARIYAETTAPLLESFAAAFEGSNIFDAAMDFDLTEDQETAFEERLAEHPGVEEQLDRFGEEAVERGVLSQKVLDGLKSRPARHAYLAMLAFAIGSAAYFVSLQVDGGEFTTSAYLSYLLIPYGPIGVHLAFQQKWSTDKGEMGK
ncbi:hypothetical protein [Dietzia cercidiphylli]|uniref:hypothetical protein n=1 Tax=Dietzia cercidiphylli TaxID=498199 RepID=UPI00223C481C|nr:hypothetical protein [Dietzia cercidiphylli]MCT1514550.1 hypothetical protein [Dietzia cercidiphylli]